MTDPTAGPLKPPKQSRSRRTLERIVTAALEILEEAGPRALTVQGVVARARSSVGSFYARFDGKDDLLDYLGDRVWREALDRWEEELATRDWAALTLDELVTGAVGLLADAQRWRAVYLRSIDEASRRRSWDAYGAFRDHLVASLSGLLLARSGEMSHPAPTDAVPFGLRAVIGAIDSAYAHDDPEPDREQLVAEGSTLLMGYLAGRPAPPPTEEVEFFDVWG